MSEGMRGGREREREEILQKAKNRKKVEKGRRMETPEQFWGQFLI